MNTAWFCVTVLWCFVLKTTDAAVTNWTTPAIAKKDGSGIIATPLAEGATTSLPTIAATGANAYAIVSQTPTGIFNITAAGQLTLVATKALDFEKAPKHVLIVRAADASSSTGTATITINISDVNDNPPVFPSSGYSACVVDKAKAGTTVLTVSTTDVDTTTAKNVISAMTFAAGNTNSDFAIATNGVITLAKAVDMATTASYALNVAAVDSDSHTKLTGTTTVSVTVAGTCGGVGILAASLLTMLVGVMTSLSSL